MNTIIWYISQLVCVMLFHMQMAFHRYGVVLRDLEMKEQARDALTKACFEVPLLWAAWQELYKLCENREMVQTVAMKCSLAFFISSYIA